MKSTAFLSEIARRTEDPPISWLMRMRIDHPNLISLAAGFTDDESLPVAETRNLLNEILASPKRGRDALQYGTTAGDARLRAWTGNELAKSDGMPTTTAQYDPERVVITSGSQQFLYILAEVLCDPGDIVIVEDPTYFVYLDILQARGLRARTVRLQKDGVDLEHLAAVLEDLHSTGELPRLKMLYLVTYFQNPSGLTTSAEKKRQVLELLRRYERAAGHSIYLLEDAAYRDLRFAGTDTRSALAFDSRDRVLYTGTYSKPFSTGARVGFGIVPEPILTAILRAKGNHDFGTANLLQQIMAAAAESGVYREHLVRLRARYALKGRCMEAAAREHFPSFARWEPARGGMYIWVALQNGLKTGPNSKLFKRALERDVLYVPGQLCYARDSTRPKPDHEMRLSFGGATEAEIKTGVQRLGEVLREFEKSASAKPRKAAPK
jgi:2-aminoadipate transaminase